MQDTGGEKVRKKNFNYPMLILWIVGGLITILFLVFAVKSIAKADGPGYDYIEQTENQTVIEYTERVAEIYPICPELLQAMIFYESSNNPDARNGLCVGYMQVSEKYHTGRADKLGVSIYDGYGNILTGTDYLMELIEKHGEVATALMVYHGESDALKKAEAGEISEYAEKVLDLSEKLERKHGK